MRLSHLRRLVAPALTAAIILAGCQPVPPRVDRSSTPLAPSSVASPLSAATIRSALSRQPLSFVENRGQLDPQVAYYVPGRASSLYFTGQGLTISLNGPPEPSTLAQSGTESAPDADAGPGGFTTVAAGAARSTQSGWAVDLEFVGARPDAQPSGVDQSTMVVNSFVGSPETWRTGVPTYGGITYADLWPGVDLVYGGSASRLKYEFVVRPGADPSPIALAYRGASALRVDANGDLVVSTPAGELRDAAPIAYQEIDGQRVEVPMTYRLDGGTDVAMRYGFDLGAYDQTRPLVMDPALIYAGFLGGNDVDEAQSIAVNADGEAFVVGWTNSANFPVKNGGPDKPFSDAFVTKISADGHSLVYSTLIGGAKSEHANGVAVDSTGRPVIVGETYSPDFPFTQDAWDTTCGTNANGDCNGIATDVFVMRLDLDGSILYSTFLGGEGPDIGTGVAIGPGDTAFVTGLTSSPQFPHKSPIPGLQPIQTQLKGNQDAFVAKLDLSKAGQNSLVYATLLGGSGEDGAQGIAVDAQGNAWITGLAGSGSNNFPLKSPTQADQPGADAFVSKLNSTGTALLFSTYLGGNDGAFEFARAIALDPAGNAYVTGHTKSTDFPVTTDAYDTTCPCLNGGPLAVFVTKYTSAGALSYSTYLGGIKHYQQARAIAVDALGDAYVLGVTASPDFPVTAGALDTKCGTDASGNCDEVGGVFAEDNFLSVLNPTGKKLMYSQFIGGHGAENSAAGGIAVPAIGVIYLTAGTSSVDFKTTPGAWDTDYNGGAQDAYAEKIVIGADLAITKTATPNPGQVNTEILYTITVRNNGPSVATGVMVDDEITTKAEYRLGPITTTQGTCTVQPNKHSIICDLGTLGKAGPATILVHLTPTVLSTAPGTPDLIKNKVTVTANEPDPKPANNTAQVSVTVKP